MPPVISRDSTGDPARRSFEDALARLFAEKAGAAVLFVPDIHDLPEDEHIWHELAQMTDPVLVLAWLYPRPTEWILRRHGVGQAGLVAVDMGAHKSPELCFEACAMAVAASTQQKEMARELTCETVRRWYPVVDYSRCINCKQCMEFCLFGVYETDAQGTVRAVRPDNCKLGCPACGRVCPRGAIMFPLYEDDDAIAGAPGQFVTPDEQATRLFEKRTSRPHRQFRDTDDDLDALIDDLDRLTQKEP